MTTLPGSLAGRRSALRITAGDATVLVALGVLVAALVALTWQTWGDLGSDTGYDLVAARRLADGSVPYADFPYFYGPLSPALGALVVLLGGTGVAPFVAFGILVSGAIVLAAYAVARLVAGPVPAALAAALTAIVAFAPGNFSFVLPHTESATLGLLGVLAFVYAAARFADGGHRPWLWGAGVAAGWVALARPETAAAVWIAGALWLGLRLAAGSSRRADIVALLAPALGLPAVVYGAAMVMTSPGRLLFDDLFPTDAIDAGAGHVLRIAAPMTAGSVAEVAGRLALYAAGLVALVLLARGLDGDGRGRAAARAILAGVALVLLATLAARPELVRHGLQFAWGWVPAGAVVGVVLLVRRARRRGVEWGAADQAELLLVTVLAVAAVRTYAAFFASATVPQQAAYALPLAAIMLAWLHDRELGARRSVRMLGVAWLSFLALAGLVLLASDAHDRSARVTGPGGTLSERPAPAATYQAALDAILRETAPGDPVLLAPQLTSLYALSGRTDPLPQISLLPGALPDPAAEDEAVRRLDSAGVDLVIVNTRPLTEYGQGAFGQTFDRRVQAWLDRDFNRVASLSHDGETSVALDVWQRRAS